MMDGDVMQNVMPLGGSVRTVRTAVRFLACVSSQMYDHIGSNFRFPTGFTDQTLEFKAAIFSPTATSVRVEAFL